MERRRESFFFLQSHERRTSHRSHCGVTAPVVLRLKSPTSLSLSFSLSQSISLSFTCLSVLLCSFHLPRFPSLFFNVGVFLLTLWQDYQISVAEWNSKEVVKTFGSFDNKKFYWKLCRMIFIGSFNWGEKLSWLLLEEDRKTETRQ